MVEPTKAGTGLMVIEVAMSNLNGDPDRESDPRTLETADGEYGLVSDVSIKRKVRDMVLFKEGPIWDSISKSLGLTTEGYDLLERPDRVLGEIGGLTAAEFLPRFWDARVFGSNFLIENTNKKSGKAKTNVVPDKDSEQQVKSHSYAGPVSLSWGKTLAPVAIIRATCTNISPVQEGKSRGMAPESYRVVEHAVYTVPFTYSPHNGRKTGVTAKDLELLLQLLPHIGLLSSRTRPQVNVRHVYYAQHASAFGSAAPYSILAALTPRVKASGPTRSWADYEDVTMPEFEGVTIVDYSANAYQGKSVA
jgi:CRISPR/Cas system type I-B associated protein Csh2 (Cas7 group RAMP superfamily)